MAVRTAEGVVHIPNRAELDARLSGWLEGKEAGKARVIVHRQLLQQIDACQRIHVKVRTVMAAPGIVPGGRMQRLHSGIHQIGDVGDLRLRSVLRRLDDHRLLALGDKAAELGLIAVTKVKLQQIPAGDVLGVLRKLYPFARTGNFAALNRISASGSALRQGVQINAGVCILVLPLQIGQIDPVLGNLDTLAENVVAQIVAVDVEVNVTVASGERQTEGLRVFPCTGVVEQRGVNVVGKKRPFLCLWHSKHGGFFGEFEIVGLFRVLPCGISAPLDLLERVVQRQYPVLINANLSRFPVRFVGVNRVKAAGFCAEKDCRQTGGARNREPDRLACAGQKMNSVGQRGGALPADDGVAVQRDRRFRVEIERRHASVFYGGQKERQALLRDPADNRIRRGLLAAVGIHLQRKPGVCRRCRVYAQSDSPNPEKEKEQRNQLSHATISSSYRKYWDDRFILPQASKKCKQDAQQNGRNAAHRVVLRFDEIPFSSA